MTFEEKAAALARDEASQKEILAILERDAALGARNAELEQRLAWLQRQLFGTKSERRIETPDARQLALGDALSTGTAPLPPSITIPSHSRQKAKKPWEESSDDSSLRFDPSVPVQEIHVPNPELADLSPSECIPIGHKVTYRLAQKPGAYVVLKFIRDVYKQRSTEAILCPPAPAAVIEKSVADVSFLVGILIDKFLYHLPLYRQHQRLQDSGIHLARATLTNLVHRSAALLEPIYQAQLRSILESVVLCMDETPIRAGREPDKKGKMHNGYFWPMYGDRKEVGFHYAPSRSLAVPRKVLEGFLGTLLTDGYVVYDRYAELVAGVTPALCWSHTRRQFVEAALAEPELCAKAIDLVGVIYAHEDAIREQELEGEKKLEYRGEHSKLAVDRFFLWLRDTLRERILVPSNPFVKAASYALERERALRVFLENPAVPVDTNHLEREIRPIALGRKNWLFCWTEIGAHYVGVVQSLIRTCKLQGVDPYTYLVDVLQRVETHPAAEVHLLTPRLWKEHFAANPLRSYVDLSQEVQLAATP